MPTILALVLPVVVVLVLAVVVWTRRSAVVPVLLAALDCLLHCVGARHKRRRKLSHRYTSVGNLVASKKACVVQWGGRAVRRQRVVMGGEVGAMPWTCGHLGTAGKGGTVDAWHRACPVVWWTVDNLLY